MRERQREMTNDGGALFVLLSARSPFAKLHLPPRIAYILELNLLINNQYFFSNQTVFQGKKS